MYWNTFEISSLHMKIRLMQKCSLPGAYTPDGAITYTKDRTSGRVWPRFRRAPTRNLLANFCKMTPKTHPKKNGITWISLTCRPVTIDCRKKNRLWIIQSGKQNWKRQLFFYFYSLSLYADSFWRAPFCWPLARYKEERDERRERLSD